MDVEYLRIRKSNLIGQFGTQIIVKKTILSLATISVKVWRLFESGENFGPNKALIQK